MCWCVEVRMRRMIEKIALGFLITMVAFSAMPMAFGEMRPLESATFPVGTYVISMDEKQDALKPGDVTVFGFIWAILNDGADIYRIIEPPDVTLNTTANPSGAVYSGGVILVNASYGAIITAQEANFSTVVVDTLTEGFTSDKVLFINKPTRILVIRGQFGHTEVTLDWMKIPYMINSTEEVAADPTMLLDYDVVVDDCAGWAKTTGVPWNVWTNMSKLASNGGELIFTDIALMDLQLVFPGYVNVVYGNDDNWTDSSSIHNPPLNFSAEYPSQYSANFPSTTKIHTMSHNYVVDRAWRPADVRVIMDTSFFNYTWDFPPHPDPTYAILGFYFPYGNGLVEGFAYHPQEQTESLTGDPNSYLCASILYGNKFVAKIPPPAVYSSDALGNEKDSFDTTETVYATVQATGQTVRLYVVADQATWATGDNLTDVSGNGYEELTLNASGNQTVKLWDPPLTTGNYDIVEDVNCNGKYDQGIDVVDSLTLIGFTAIPEFSFGIAVITLISMTAILIAYKKLKRFTPKFSQK
jgi:hypothetical protein